MTKHSLIMYNGKKAALLLKTQIRKFQESLETMKTIYNKKFSLNFHAEIDY